MTRFGGRKLALLVVAFAIASSYGVPAAPESSASTCQLREIYPPNNAVVDSHTVLSASIDYSINDASFSPNTYFVHALFSTPDGKTFNRTKRIEDGVAIREKAGVVLVKYPIKREWSDKYLGSPITVRFAMLKRTSTLDMTNVAQTEPTTYERKP